MSVSRQQQALARGAAGAASQCASGRFGVQTGGTPTPPSLMCEMLVCAPSIPVATSGVLASAEIFSASKTRSREGCAHLCVQLPGTKRAMAKPLTQSVNSCPEHAAPQQPTHAPKRRAEPEISGAPTSTQPSPSPPSCSFLHPFTPSPTIAHIPCRYARPGRQG